MFFKSGRNLATPLIGILVVIALAGSLAFGQVTASISGVVRDTTGAVLPGVGITATHTDSGLMRTTISNENGSYSLPSLPVGPYELTTELAGFKQQVRRGITLAVGQEAVLNLTLEVGAVAEKVEVTEEAPLVNTTNRPSPLREMSASVMSFAAAPPLLTLIRSVTCVDRSRTNKSCR